MTKDRNKDIFDQKIGSLLQKENIQYEFVQNDDFEYVQLNRVLISNYASWSGYTFMVGISMIKRLSNKLSRKKVKHIVLDCDYVNSKRQLEIFNTASWGYFESSWIENGIILRQYKYKQELEPFLEYVEERIEQIP